jgi:hypothetical protein
MTTPEYLDQQKALLREYRGELRVAAERVSEYQLLAVAAGELSGRLKNLAEPTKCTPQLLLSMSARHENDQCRDRLDKIALHAHSRADAWNRTLQFLTMKADRIAVELGEDPGPGETDA